MVDHVSSHGTEVNASLPTGVRQLPVVKPLVKKDGYDGLETL